MEREVDWIKTALARDRTKTQSGLAGALNLDKSSVSRMLNGERRLKFDEAYRAAAYLGIDLPAGFAEENAAFDHTGVSSGEIAAAALFRVDAGEGGFWRLYQDKILELKSKSGLVADAPSAFGFYTPDDAMSPRFKTGEIVWINPNRPAPVGGDALAVEKSSAGDGDVIFLCEFVSAEKGKIQVRQYKTEKTKSLDPGKWAMWFVYPRG